MDSPILVDCLDGLCWNPSLDLQRVETKGHFCPWSPLSSTDCAGNRRLRAMMRVSQKKAPKWQRFPFGFPVNTNQRKPVESHARRFDRCVAPAVSGTPKLLRSNSCYRAMANAEFTDMTSKAMPRESMVEPQRGNQSGIGNWIISPDPYLKPRPEAGTCNVCAFLQGTPPLGGGWSVL